MLLWEVVCEHTPGKACRSLPCCRSGLLPRGTSWGAQRTPGVRLCPNEANPPSTRRHSLGFLPAGSGRRSAA